MKRDATTLALLCAAISVAAVPGCDKAGRLSAPGIVTVRTTLADVDWLNGQYFLLYDPDHGPAYDVDAQSLRLYLDGGNATNDANTVLGKAVLDPGGAMGLPLTPEQSAASVLGRFDPLTPGVPGHDGRVDGLGFNRQTLGRVDYARGLLFLPDLHPFAPRTDPAVSHPFESFVADHVNRRLRLGRPGAPVTPEPDLYELYNPRLTDAHWFLDVSFSRPPTGPVTSEVRH